MVRVSQDSLLLAHSCCVLSQFFSLLGFGEGGLVNLISAFNYLRILRQNSGATVQTIGIRDGTETLGQPVLPSPLPGAHARVYGPGTRSW